MLLRFVDTEPRRRYDQLEPFLNLERYLKVENALRELVNTSTTDLATQQAIHNGIQQKLRTIFALQQTDAISAERLLSALNTCLKEAGLETIESLEDVAEASTKIGYELGDGANDERLGSLHALKSQAQKLGFAANYKDLISQLSDAAANLEQELADRATAVQTEFLTMGKQIIASQDGSECPVCEQPIDKVSVIARLESRIAADERITSAKGRVTHNTRVLLDSIRALSSSMRLFIADWAETVINPLPMTYASTAALLGEVVDALAKPIVSGEVRSFAVRLAGTVASHDQVIATLDHLIVEEGGGERRKKLSDASLMVNGLRTEWTQCREAEGAVKASKAMLVNVERLYGHAIEARKATVQQQLDDVADIANTFYDTLHSGENIANSKLSVRPSEEGSVSLETVFYGKTAPPLLYYSESHLDTLGLCYFLALRKREARKEPQFRVLVLDDVVHSVDASHRVRFASLLKDQFSDHQIIISTHDKLFFDRLGHVFGEGGYKYLAFTTWTIDRGPGRSDASTDLDRILDEKVRLSKSTEELSAAAGRLFEWMLRQLTERLEVSIPARFEREHDIGSMWPPLGRKLRKQHHFRAVHPNLVELLDANLWVRNAVGAHYNEPAAPVDPEEVRDFAAHLAALYRETYCAACGAFIKRNGDQDWKCHCGRKAYSASPTAEAKR